MIYDSKDSKRVDYLFRLGFARIYCYKTSNYIVSHDVRNKILKNTMRLNIDDN